MTGLVFVVVPLSCTTLRAVNPSSMSVAQINQLTKETFDECGDILGSADGYSAPQLNALSVRVIKVRPPVCGTQLNQSVSQLALATCQPNFGLL